MTPDEISDQEGSDAPKQIMISMHKKLEFQVFLRDQGSIGLEDAQKYHPHENETQSEQTFPPLQEELEPSPEVADCYLGVPILVLRWNNMTRGHVMTCMRDAKRKMKERAHVNPTLDSRVYQAEFPGGKLQN